MYIKSITGQIWPFNTAYNGDLLDYTRELPDKCIPWVLTDPNYGIKEHGGTNRSHYVKQKNGSKLYVTDGNYEKKSWDNEAISEEVLKEIIRVSENQIIFGVNYFPFNPGPGRIVWDKCREGDDQSDCEIAYCSLIDRVDKIVYMWRGMMQGKSIEEGNVQQGNKKLNEKRIHPTQKPVKLISYILKKYIPEGTLIADFFLGSFSHAIACNNMGNPWIGTEKDKEIYDEGYERYNKETETKQPSLF